MPHACSADCSEQDLLLASRMLHCGTRSALWSIKYKHLDTSAAVVHQQVAVANRAGCCHGNSSAPANKTHLQECMADSALPLELQQQGRNQLLDTIRQLREQLRQQGDQLVAQQRSHEQLLQGFQQLQQAVGTAVDVLGSTQQRLTEQQQQQVQAVFEHLTTACRSAQEVLNSCHKRLAQTAEAAAVHPTAAAAKPVAATAVAASREVAAAEGVAAAVCTTASAQLTQYMQQQGPGAVQQEVAALDVVLQQSDLSHSCSLLCALLGTSKELQPLIHQRCRGQLAVKMHHPEQGARWISKHGCLLQQLKLGELSSAAGSTAFVSALRAAAATPGGLQIQSFISPTANSMLLKTLSALCSSSLTSLAQ